MSPAPFPADPLAAARPACPVCASAARLEWPLPAVDVLACARCGHRFSELRDGAMEQYGAAYYDDAHRNWFEHPNVAAFEAIRRQLSTLGRDISVIDIGCGQGDLLHYLRQREPGWRLLGIDAGQGTPKPGIEIIRGDFQTHRFDRRFDAVISLNTIEHVADVRGFARRMLDLCEPGGMGVVMTLNDHSILYGVARLLHRTGLSGPMIRLYDRHHLNHFSIDSLSRLLDAAGWQAGRTLRHNTPLAAIDLPASSSLAGAIQRIGVWGTFLLGRLTGATYLQTVVARAAPTAP